MPSASAAQSLGSPQGIDRAASWLYYATVVTSNRFAKVDSVSEFQATMYGLIRSLGLHRPDTTPCGQPMSVGEAHALIETSNEPGITQNGLTQRLQLDKSTVSRLITMLERRGWIERYKDQFDNRFYHLRLTARGNEVCRDLKEARRAKFQRVFDAIPSAKRGGVAASLSIILEALNES